MLKPRSVLGRSSLDSIPKGQNVHKTTETARALWEASGVGVKHAAAQGHGARKSYEIQSLLGAEPG